MPQNEVGIDLFFENEHNITGISLQFDPPGIKLMLPFDVWQELKSNLRLLLLNNGDMNEPARKAPLMVISCDKARALVFYPDHNTLLRLLHWQIDVESDKQEIRDILDAADHIIEHGGKEGLRKLQSEITILNTVEVWRNPN